ncbi:hypothetical protein [Halioxenophilus aromaticivorans]|uniref:hypothetical protein n=1 Tax=Halioxenophilus aromaticivorans TaxID=1306992 RepID=UPI0031E69FC3
MRLLLVLVALLSVGCGRFSVQTNASNVLAGQTSALLVKEYAPTEIAQYDASVLGYVEASDCQQRASDTKPNRRSVVNKLKIQTQKMGGNGLVVMACAESVEAMCNRYLACRAEAYLVPER